jgi:hypothetical protein
LWCEGRTEADRIGPVK